MYQNGMKILMLDASDCKTEDTEEQLPRWKRAGHDIKYIQNHYTNDTCPSGLFQIEFSFEFDKGEKQIYFSHSVPYTYSMLNEYLNKNVTKEKAKRATLCHSLAGNKVEYLTITNKVKKPAVPEEELSPTPTKIQLKEKELS